MDIGKPESHMPQTQNTGPLSEPGSVQVGTQLETAGSFATSLFTRDGSPGPRPGRPRRPRPPKLYRIGEVVEYSAMSRQTIHNYTTMGLLQESRWTAGGHRLYDESVFERLDTISELKAQSKSLQDIREYFARCDAV